MTKLKRYSTVVLLEAIDGFQKNQKGAVVEVYNAPYEAYDIEIVTDEGKTLGLLEAVLPSQIEALPTTSESLHFEDIRLDADRSRVAIEFSNGRKIIVRAEELYALAA